MSSRARPCFHALFKNPMMATIFAEQHKCQPLLPTREGCVQAERPTRTRPQGQGNGPEGERHTELDRSPCPGRRCPCGCPQQVDRLGHPLARGVARMRPGWLPTIVAGPAQPCPQRDETRQESPQTRLVASRRTDRALSPKGGLDLVPEDGAVLCDLSSGGVGSLNVRQILRRLGEPLQVLDVGDPGGSGTRAHVLRWRRRRCHRAGYTQQRQASRA